MAYSPVSITFTDFQTPVPAAWLNFVNQVVNNINNAATTQAASIAALRLVDATVYQTAVVQGYYAIGDLGGGIYVYNPLDHSSADNGGTIIVGLAGARWYLSYTGYVSVRQFGAKGDGVTNDTPAINAAFTAMYAAGKPLYFPTGTYGVTDLSANGYALFNPGVSFFGDGMVHSQIVPLTSMPITSNFMEIQPSGGAFLDFLYVRDMFFNPTVSSVKYGATCIYWNFNTSSNASGVDISGVYCAPGNAYSMIWNNNTGVNTQGIPAELSVTRCAFWEGLQFLGGGDSNRFRDVTLRSTAGSTRVGIQYNAVGSVGNAPSCISIEDCNFDCSGGAVTIFGSYQTSIRHNNIEMSAGSGSGSGACVDIDGTEIANSFAHISDNLISLFGTSTATSGVRVNVCESAIIEDNRFLSGHTVNQAILITGNAVDTYVGLNEIGGSYTVPVNDLGGTGTRGLRKSLSLVNGWTNGAPGASVSKNKEGRVSLEGSLTNAGGSASGTTITTLPASYWPSVGLNFIVYGVISGIIAPVELFVSSVGVVSFGSTNNITAISLNGITFDTTSYIISSN